VRLNASTLSTFYYEPSQLARLLTTLDVLSDGKLMRFAESSIDEAFVDAFAVFPQP
jgi:alkanesulfonate monooxygenase SsuD/methylene tetrahydromethanopterin reductase-like flavin-dependent oxidoreductase (luciferase family)